MYSPRRPTIGFLTYSSRGPVWAGCVEAARVRDANLIGLAGWWLDDPSDYRRQANVLYDLAPLGRLNGLIIWSSALGTYIGHEATQRFCERFKDLPIVSIGSTIPGALSVLADERQGIRQLVAHLVEAHGCARIACISGPSQHPDLAVREQAFSDSLSIYGLPFDPDMLIRVNDDNEDALRETLQVRLRQISTRFDAIVVVLGSVVSSVIDVLQAHGVRVPHDIIVVSFGQSFQTAVPLTAMAYPFYEQGRLAVNLLLDQLAHRPIIEKAILPLRLMVGETCGCHDPKVIQAAVNRSRPAGSVTLAGPRPAVLSRASMVEDLHAAVGELATGLPPGWGHQLLESFEADARDGTSERFLGVLKTTLVHAARASREPLVIEGEMVLRGGDLGIWQQVVSALRRWVRYGWLGPHNSERTEDLLHQARVFVGEVAQRSQAFHNIRTHETDRMAHVSQALSSTLDRHEMFDALTRELPRLDIPGCYLALYTDPTRPTGEAMLMFAVTPAGRLSLPEKGVPFPAGSLLPDPYWPTDRRFTAVIEALYVREQHQGFVIFEAPLLENVAAQTLRAQISASLAAAELFERNVNLYNEADAARYQAEQANRMKSHFLSTVSHELRTPLALIVGLSEMLIRRADFTTLPSAYAEDMKRILVSTQHLDRLVRDVLDLASSQVDQLRLFSEPLDMTDTLHAVAVMGAQLARDKGLAWNEQIPTGMPLVWGDHTRLRQVVLNLVSNAIKFTDHGTIALLVSVGDGRLYIEIHDTGMGVLPDEQAHIFDEFYRSSRLVGSSGGMGLGLAISRRLIELHGGQIVVRSSGRSGEGAVFTITLPTLPAHTSAHAIASALGTRSDTVLILSPPGCPAQGLRHYLEQQSYIVEELLLDGDNLWLASIQLAPPGVLIVNWQPGAIQGWDLLERLKNHHGTQSLPVLFYTIDTTTARGGVVEVELLPKPVNDQALAQAITRQHAEPRRILVVDDEPGLLELHARAIEMRFRECEVLRANNGVEAWAQIRTYLPELVLLDLMMPEMDGFTVLEAMRSMETTRAIPVIILTAKILTDKEIARLNRGVASVLGKGVFSIDETLSHIAIALQRTRRLGSEMQRMVRKAMAYIHEHYAQPIARKDLARYSGVSERYLTRCFTQETGLTPSTYLTRYRISRARQLLETTNRSITEIALDSGFSSTSYFGQVFRQQLGLTPQEYRAKRS